MNMHNLYIANQENTLSKYSFQYSQCNYFPSNTVIYVKVSGYIQHAFVLQDTLQPLSMQALPALPESLSMVQMGGGRGGEGEGALVAVGGLFLNIGLTNGVLLRTALDSITGDLSDTRTRYPPLSLLLSFPSFFPLFSFSSFLPSSCLFFSFFPYKTLSFLSFCLLFSLLPSLPFSFFPHLFTLPFLFFLLLFLCFLFFPFLRFFIFPFFSSYSSSFLLVLTTI